MSKIYTILKMFRFKFLFNLKTLIKKILFPSKRNHIKRLNRYKKYFTYKVGIEIGGPSTIFSRELPIYEVIKGLDGCNFSNQTIWEGEITEGKNYNYYKNKKGYQFICEASNLKAIPNEYYDFLIASHCLEHCANTLLTVKEWLRIIKEGGAILLILPGREYTFDHRRSVTTFKHLEDDLKNEINESDLTHLREILELHDLEMDLPAGIMEQFKNRSLNNYKNRCLHHHVFDFQLLHMIFDHFGVKVIDRIFVKPYHQIILGIKQ